MCTHLFSVFTAPKERARTGVVGVEHLWLRLCRLQCIYGTTFGPELHLHICLLRQPLITNTATKSNFVGKSTNADFKMTTETAMSIALACFTSYRFERESKCNFQCDQSRLSWSDQWTTTNNVIHRCLPQSRLKIHPECMNDMRFIYNL